MPGDAAHPRAHGERYFYHLIERWLVTGRAQNAIVFTAVNVLESRPCSKDAAATGTKYIPGQLEYAETRGMQKRSNGALFVKSMLAGKDERVDAAKVAVGTFANQLLNGGYAIAVG